MFTVSLFRKETRSCRACNTELLGRLRVPTCLFDGSSQPCAFKLSSSAVSPNGVIAATYVRDGEVKTATVGGAHEPSPAELARREKLRREG